MNGLLAMASQCICQPVLLGVRSFHSRFAIDANKGPAKVNAQADKKIRKIIHEAIRQIENEKT